MNGGDDPPPSCSSFLSHLPHPLETGFAQSDDVDKCNRSSPPPIQLKHFPTPHPMEIGASAVNEGGQVGVPRKLKATSAPVSYLRIGKYEVKSQFEAHLLAKWYYSKQRLIWEILEKGLKFKIEICWSDVSAISVVTPLNQSGLLEIELEKQPRLFRETDFRARKHSTWMPTPDFTAGQVYAHRVHHLTFPPGCLDRNMESLFCCDSRLAELSKCPFPRVETLFLCDKPSCCHNISSDATCRYNEQSPSQFPPLQMNHACHRVNISANQLPLLQHSPSLASDSDSPSTLMLQNGANIDPQFGSPMETQIEMPQSYGASTSRINAGYSLAVDDNNHHNHMVMTPKVPYMIDHAYAYPGNGAILSSGPAYTELDLSGVRMDMPPRNQTHTIANGIGHGHEGSTYEFHQGANDNVKISNNGHYMNNGNPCDSSAHVRAHTGNGTVFQTGIAYCEPVLPRASMSVPVSQHGYTREWNMPAGQHHTHNRENGICRSVCMETLPRIQTYTMTNGIGHGHEGSTYKDHQGANDDMAISNYGPYMNGNPLDRSAHVAHAGNGTVVLQGIAYPEPALPRANMNMPVSHTRTRENGIGHDRERFPGNHPTLPTTNNEPHLNGAFHHHQRSCFQ